MHQAQVTAWGQPPQYAEVPEPPPPSADELRIKVAAAGLHRVVRSRAEGQHYSSGALPHVPGIDGVGATEDGKSVYFSSMSLDTMTEQLNVPKRAVVPIPDGLDPLRAAGMINPAMSSWMAFKARTSRLETGFSVLILGATSASRRIAIPIARSLGAGRVIGAARSRDAMDSLGLDGQVIVADEVEKTDFSAIGDIDIIIDYISGPLTLHLFNTIKTPKPVDYVHVGGLSGVFDVTVPGAVLRSKDITIRGSGPGSWSMPAVLKELPGMLEALKSAPEQPVKIAKLADVESEWNKESKERVVFAP